MVLVTVRPSGFPPSFWFLLHLVDKLLCLLWHPWESVVPGSVLASSATSLRRCTHTLLSPLTQATFPGPETSKPPQCQSLSLAWLLNSCSVSPLNSVAFHPSFSHKQTFGNRWILTQAENLDILEKKCTSLQLKHFLLNTVLFQHCRVHGCVTLEHSDSLRGSDVWADLPHSSRARLLCCLTS